MQSPTAIKAYLKKPLTKAEKLKLESYMNSFDLSRKKQEDLDKRLFIEAEQSKNDEFSQLLIRAGANVNASIGARGTCLHVAAKVGSPSMVALLLYAGANPNALNSRGSTPLDSAMPMNTPNLLLNPEAKEKIKLLLANGADVNVPSPYYKTLFHVALLYSKSDELAMLFVNNGLDVKYSSKEGSYLHCASEFSSMEVVQALLDKGADIHFAGGQYNAIPFYYAMDNKKLSDSFLLKLLPPQNIEDALVYSVYNRNKFYLQKACNAKRLAVIRFLLERGADPKSVQEENGHPLDDNVKQLLVQSMSADYVSEITAKMVLFMMSSFYHREMVKSKKLSLQDISQLRYCIINALNTPAFLHKLGNSQDSYALFLRAELIRELQKKILLNWGMNKFSLMELTASIHEVLKLWLEKNSHSEPQHSDIMEEQSPRDVSMHSSPRELMTINPTTTEPPAVPAGASRPDKVYSSATAQHTFYAPPVPPRPVYPAPIPSQVEQGCSDKNTINDEHEMDVEVKSLKRGVGNGSV